MLKIFLPKLKSFKIVFLLFFMFVSSGFVLPAITHSRFQGWGILFLTISFLGILIFFLQKVSFSKKPKEFEIQIVPKKYLPWGKETHTLNDFSHLESIYPPSKVVENSLDENATFRVDIGIKSRLEKAISNSLTRIILFPENGKNGETVLGIIKLAQELTLEGYRICVVEADFRQPCMHRTYSIENCYGFSNNLINLSKDFKSHRVDEGGSSYFFIPSGPIPPVPETILSSHKTQVFFDRLKRNYELVLVKMPPMQQFRDFYLMNSGAKGLVILSSNSKGSESINLRPEIAGKFSFIIFE
ncbi:MAG: hypothetical protein HQM08_01080 [Candidatus Riflebacteria bacterium]|nr:hypothetical protein [Candidatus Riflebacteria bacterium]